MFYGLEQSLEMWIKEPEERESLIIIETGSMGIVVPDLEEVSGIKEIYWVFQIPMKGQMITFGDILSCLESILDTYNPEFAISRMDIKFEIERLGDTQLPEDVRSIFSCQFVGNKVENYYQFVTVRNLGYM